LNLRSNQNKRKERTTIKERVYKLACYNVFLVCNYVVTNPYVMLRISTTRLESTLPFLS